MYHNQIKSVKPENVTAYSSINIYHNQINMYHNQIVPQSN
jgi:hypothetical protein